MEVDKLADMLADMVADMEVNMVADLVADMDMDIEQLLSFASLLNMGKKRKWFPRWFSPGFWRVFRREMLDCFRHVTIHEKSCKFLL